MKHLLFVGPQSVGKTTVIGRIARILVNSGYTVDPDGVCLSSKKWVYGMPVHPWEDFYVLLEKDGRHILLYSWGDVKSVVQWLANYLRELKDRGINPSLVIMATHDASEPLYNFTYQTLALNSLNCIEFPMGRMPRGKKKRAIAVKWYLGSAVNHVERFLLPELLE